MQVPTTGANAGPNVGVYAGPAWNAALKAHMVALKGSDSKSWMYFSCLSV